VQRVDEVELVNHSYRRLVGASAVGRLLADYRGRLEFLAASDENTRLMWAATGHGDVSRRWAWSLSRNASSSWSSRMMIRQAASIAVP
jgi:hypothetical protein